MAIKGKTSTGFEFEIEDTVKDDYELVEALAELEVNGLMLPKVMRKLLGDKVEDLKNHIRADDGHVSTQKLMAELKEIFSEQGNLKK
ncbi:hypothetical protein [Streptococcus sp. S784/96/1]|uniref:hypothetical protein n=1 Tax=Streptococcus sp. S784/96/1 TaxID=2653499 RepID=UPI001EE43D6D|nr:hypothetical protein [Streptococcus sp. S784/96/1]